MNRTRQRAETEVLSLIDRASTPPLNGYYSGTGSGSQNDQATQQQPQQVVVVPLQRHFTFDHIFGTGSSQEDVYQGSVKRMVDKFLEGKRSSARMEKKKRETTSRSTDILRL